MYRRDEALIKDWVKAAEDPDTSRAYLDKYVYGVKNHQEYLDLIGADRLQSLRQGVSHEQPGE